MKENMIKKGFRVMDKIDGDYYVITNVRNGEGYAEKECVNPETKEEYLDATQQAVINKDNCIAFRFVGDALAPEVPVGFSVKDGILLDNNNNPVCEQGEIFVNKILALQPNKLLLSAIYEGRKGIYTYNTRKDRFIYVCSGEPIYICDCENEDYAVLLAFSEKITETITDENGKDKKIEKLMDSRIVTIDANGNVESKKLNVPILEVRKVNKKKGLFAVISKTTTDAEGYLSPAEKYYTYVKNFFHSGEGVRFFTECCPDIITESVKGYVVKTQNECLVYNNENDAKYAVNYNKDIKKKLKGFDYIVNVTDSAIGVRMTFANENYEIKTVMQEITPDRGIITYVE